MHGDGIVFIWRTESCERHYKFRDTHITSPRVFSNVLLDFGQEQRSPVSVLISKPSSKARLRELITRIRHNFCQHFWVGFLATVTLRVTNRHRFGHSGLFIDADVVVGGSEDVKSINEAVGAGPTTTMN